jgi:hypothetical protein
MYSYWWQSLKNTVYLTLKKSKRKATRKSFFFHWVLINTVTWALFFGLVFNAVFDDFTGGLTLRAEWRADPFPWLFILLGAGILMGGSQWFVLRSYLQHAEWWIWATLGGVVFGYASSRLLVSEADMAHDLLFIFFFVAAFQSIILLVNFKLPGLLWLPLKGLGLLFSPYFMPITTVLEGQLGVWERYLTPIVAIGALLSCTILPAGIIFALITGLYLARLLSFPAAKTTSVAELAEKTLPDAL